MKATGPIGMPSADVDVTTELVRALLHEQHPDLAGLDLRVVANGWDNVIFRLGDELTVRMPRRAAAAELVGHEQRWLPQLAPHLPIPVPAPVRVGLPDRGYPWRWSVNPWFEGEPAVDAALAAPRREAERLGEFLAVLHRPAPPDAPANPSRDCFVGDRDDSFRRYLDASSDELDRLVPDGASRAAASWDDLVTTPHGGQPVWVVGDLHAANVLVHEGAISAVIDFGDLCAGDAAVDLAIGWMLFDADARRTFRAAAGDGSPTEEDTWRRGEAWALLFGLMYISNSADEPRMARMGRGLLATVLTERAD